MQAQRRERERESGVWEGVIDVGQRHGLGRGSKWGEARGRTWEWGKNAVSGFSLHAKRRIERLREEGEEADGQAPHVRETMEERRGRPDGPRPKRRKEFRGLGKKDWPGLAEFQVERISSFVFKPIFKCICNLNFKSNLFCVNSHIT